jgi:hypothetical protein
MILGDDHLFLVGRRLLLQAPKAMSVVGRRPDQQRRRDSCATERTRVHGPVEIVRLDEAAVEGQDQEEGEQDLHAGNGDAQLVQELDQVTIEPLFLSLLVVHRPDATRGDALAHRTGAPWAAWSRSGTTRLAIPET